VPPRPKTHRSRAQKTRRGDPDGHARRQYFPNPARWTSPVTPGREARARPLLVARSDYMGQARTVQERSHYREGSATGSATAGDNRISLPETDRSLTGSISASQHVFRLASACYRRGQFDQPPDLRQPTIRWSPRRNSFAETTAAPITPRMLSVDTPTGHFAGGVTRMLPTRSWISIPRISAWRNSAPITG
jgi:hypothetical protein